ncbi:RNA polymerase sigma factor [Alkalicella caledoniensis]|uniref:RNA polymerase sigma factor n=1 Tax=Alkalicella caledoniensis TaxID=2731377 RepID=A0A7G9W9N4_ALKCA|nr:RNA polymerase sigma factor [Alkalicella caledoniensis]QNO15396.1 RNA polymerase sigma factor [Alkalicella caledoniensis]
MHLGDDQLVKEIISGSKSSLDVLVNRYYELIYSYSMRQVNDYHLACDLTQEVFVKMMMNINKYRVGTDSFKYWLLKIALNHIRDYFRSEKNRKSTAFDNMEYLSNNDINNDNMINMLEIHEKSKEVKKAIYSLKEQEKEIVILKYYNDMTIKEISGITGNNESTIKSRLYRALEKLRRHLKGGDIIEKRSNGKR